MEIGGFEVNLDSRIYEGKKPLTAFDAEEARQFIGTEGYFATASVPFGDLNYTVRGVLAEIVSDMGAGIFRISDGDAVYRYFLPEAWVESTEEEQEFAWDSLKLAGELHFILHSGCYVGRGSVSDDDLKTIAEIMAKHSHEEEKFLRDVFERVLTFDEGQW